MKKVRPKPAFQEGDKIRLTATHRYGRSPSVYFQKRIDATPNPGHGVITIVDWDKTEVCWTYQVNYGRAEGEDHLLILWTDAEVMELEQDELQKEQVDAAIASILKVIP